MGSRRIQRNVYRHMALAALAERSGEHRKVLQRDRNQEE